MRPQVPGAGNEIAFVPLDELLQLPLSLEEDTQAFAPQTAGVAILAPYPLRLLGALADKLRIGRAPLQMIAKVDEQMRNVADPITIPPQPQFELIIRCL